MNNQLTPEYIDKGLLVTCEEGKAILDAWGKVLNDYTIETMSPEFVEAWDKWIYHRKTCAKCGYI